MATTKKTKATAKQTDTTTREPAAKDAMGCREGSQSAAINAALTAKPQDVATLAEKSGATPARVRNHLRYLLGKELIVQGDDGYSLPPKAKPRAKRTRKSTR